MIFEFFKIKEKFLQVSSKKIKRKYPEFLIGVKIVKKILKGCVRYIFARLFLSLNESPCQTRKNVFYLTSKTLFVLEKIKF